MRFLFFTLCVVVLLAGLLFGALNPQPVSVDLYLIAFDLRLGVALLIAVLVGALIGGLCAATAMTLRRRRSQRIAALEPTPVPSTGSLVE
jgi:lipopolysaccharide assembly protein A